MRARKPKNIPERLERYSAVIEKDLPARRGHWLERCPQARELRLDLGCGKGAFAIESARREPDVLFVGIDGEDICIALAAQKAVEAGVGNVVFATGDADCILDMFAPGEIDVLHLNFSTPCPRAKHAPRRLTYADRLMQYRELLAADGCIKLKTDSYPFFDWSLTQFEAAAYQVEDLTRDLHASPMAQGNVQTEYEQRLVQLGAKIHACTARPQAAPEQVIQGHSMSLGDYLPDDLEALEYVPYGMEDFVRNQINAQRKAGGQ